MVNAKTAFFKHTNCFLNAESVKSTPIIVSELDYTPTVTIAIPTYKRSSLLRESIDSALSQIDYHKYDVMVVDNNPERNDETENLLVSYVNTRLSYYKNDKNLEMIGNWNRLYSLAKGDWVVMLHDDDILLPNYLLTVMSVVSKNPKIEMLTVKYDFFKNGRILYNSSYLNGSLNRIKPVDFALCNLIGPPIGLLLKKESMSTFGGFNEKFYPTSDYCFYATFSLHHRSYILHKTLAQYRIENNTSLNRDVLDSFVVNDYFFTREMLKNIFCGSFSDEYFFRYKAKLQIASIRSFWNVEISGLPYGLSDGANKRKWIEKVLFRIFCYVLRFLRIVKLDDCLIYNRLR